MTRLMSEKRVPFRPVAVQRFFVRFNAQNGFWEEQLQVAKIGPNAWAQAIRVFNKSKVVFTKVDPKFPTVKGRVIWD